MCEEAIGNENCIMDKSDVRVPRGLANNSEFSFVFDSQVVLHFDIRVQRKSVNNLIFLFVSVSQGVVQFLE